MFLHNYQAVPGNAHWACSASDMHFSMPQPTTIFFKIWSSLQYTVTGMVFWNFKGLLLSLFYYQEFKRLHMRG